MDGMMLSSMSEWSRKRKMMSKRAHILWIPEKRTGKVRSALMHPGYLRALLCVVLACILSIPFMEGWILSLKDQIRVLEVKKQELHSELARLEYVKQELADIASQEEELKAYFGMSRYRSLKQAVGGAHGGTPKLESDLSKSVFKTGLATTVSKEALQHGLETMKENFDTVGSLMIKQSEAWENTPSVVPVAMSEPTISSGFGWRKNPFTNKREFHAGIDIIGRTGEGVIAPAHGVVLNIGYDRWLGKYLVVQHSDEIKTIYGHLSEISVTKGQKVGRGEEIGLIGNTGLSTSSHLHYSVVENDRVVDPMQYILDLKG